MRVAYFSPLNPLRSGISDYSEELLPHLKGFMDIDLFVDDYEPDIGRDGAYKIYNIDIYEKKKNEYDAAIFHVGNNLKYHKKIVDMFFKTGGILELHDISLHNFIAGDTIDRNDPDEYVRLMEYSHGSRGKKTALDYVNGLISAPWENPELYYTVNKHLVDKAQAIIVHSDFAKQTLKGINGDKIITSIPLHTSDLVKDCDQYKRECRKALNIDRDLFVIGSFGFATESKRITKILEALMLLKTKTQNKFHYFIVGDIDSNGIRDKIDNLGLNVDVTITGFTDLDLFRTYMGACDICVNLRYPTQGESSGSVPRMLGRGKPVIVTKIGSFQELPDDFAIKVPYDSSEVDKIYEAVKSLMSDRKVLKAMAQNAYNYAISKCNIEVNAEKYYKFIRDVINGTYEDDYIDSFIDKLFKLRLIDDFYIDNLAKKNPLAFL